MVWYALGGIIGWNVNLNLFSKWMKKDTRLLFNSFSNYWRIALSINIITILLLFELPL